MFADLRSTSRFFVCFSACRTFCSVSESLPLHAFVSSCLVLVLGGRPTVVRHVGGRRDIDLLFSNSGVETTDFVNGHSIRGWLVLSPGLASLACTFGSRNPFITHLLGLYTASSEKMAQSIDGWVHVFSYAMHRIVLCDAPVPQKGDGGWREQVCIQHLGKRVASSPWHLWHCREIQ